MLSRLDLLYPLINDPHLINGTQLIKDLTTRQSVVFPSERCSFSNATRDLLFGGVVIQ